MGIKLDYNDFNNYLQRKVLDASLLKKTASTALGFSIARHIPLPTLPVVNLDEHYRNSVQNVILKYASIFNEQIVVDLSLVEDVARGYWLMRYYTLYPLPIIPLTEDKETHFFAKLSGTAHLINPEIHAFCTTNAEVMIILINRITGLLFQD